MPTKDLHTEKISRGSRTYFFDVKKSVNDGLYLKMSCSQKSHDGFEHFRLIVFERDILEFVAAVRKSAGEIQKLKQQPATVRKLRPK
ncbi:MAG: DUF3276 family protein [Flavobacterium sp.]|nr:MAG: DUF3276 family protein [Flavobacterium sp.]